MIALTPSPFLPGLAGLGSAAAPLTTAFLLTLHSAAAKIDCADPLAFCESGCQGHCYLDRDLSVCRCCKNYCREPRDERCGSIEQCRSVDGTWDDWSKWGDCENFVQRRRRACVGGRFDLGGRNCTGIWWEDQSCGLDIALKGVMSQNNALVISSVILFVIVFVVVAYLIFQNCRSASEAPVARGNGHVIGSPEEEMSLVIISEEGEGDEEEVKDEERDRNSALEPNRKGSVSSEDGAKSQWTNPDLPVQDRNDPLFDEGGTSVKVVV